MSVLTLPSPPVEGVSSDRSDGSSSPPADVASDGLSSDGRDSGVEADCLDPELARQIVEAVELYFSDESLLRDAFLLKHVKRNKEGFVSVKLISSFKRVKQLSRDWRVVSAALRRGSDQLEANDAGSKVRRLQPLPEHDETVTSRTVVAVNLPLENPTIASVSELFGKCGDISSIRVLKPGSAIPVEVRAAFNKHPDVAWEDVNCAVVEFDLQEQARRAIDTMSTADVDPDSETNSGMHIIPISKVSNKKKSRQEELSGREDISINISSNMYSVLGSVITSDSQKKRRQRRKKLPLEHSGSRSSLSGTDGEATPARRATPPQGSPLMSCPPPLLSRPPPLLTQPPPLLSHPPPLLSQLPPLLNQPPPLLSRPPPLLPLPTGLVARRASATAPRSSKFASTDIRQQDSESSRAPQRRKTPPTTAAAAPADFTAPPPAGPCPWVQRRKASGALDGDRRGSLVHQQNVVRAPHGPDGTSGFTVALRRSRPTPAPAAQT